MCTLSEQLADTKDQFTYIKNRDLLLKSASALEVPSWQEHNYFPAFEVIELAVRDNGMAKIILKSGEEFSVPVTGIFVQPLEPIHMI